MSEPILTVANMNKKFGSTVALNDVSLTVYPGEIKRTQTFGEVLIKYLM